MHLLDENADFVTTGVLDIVKNKTVIVHPIVLLSAVDHYNRVAHGTKRRVVGTLLGEIKKHEIHVSASFAVPFEEDLEDSAVWFFDKSYHENMVRMFKKINQREQVLGWYSTGPRLRAADLTIHEIFRKYCSNPIYIIVDLNPEDSVTPTEAYVSIPVASNTELFTNTFVHVPSVIGAYEAEEVGVEHLLKDLPNHNACTLSSQIDDKISSLKTFVAKLKKISVYLDDILQNQMPPNVRVMKNIQNILNAIPCVGSRDFQQEYCVQQNDLLLMNYTASLARAVTAFGDLIV